jgi:hypothetical protein
LLDAPRREDFDLFRCGRISFQRGAGPAGGPIYCGNLQEWVAGFAVVGVEYDYVAAWLLQD